MRIVLGIVSHEFLDARSPSLDPLHVLAVDVPPLSHGLGGETVAIVCTFNRYTSPPLPSKGSK